MIGNFFCLFFRNSYFYAANAVHHHLKHLKIGNYIAVYIYAEIVFNRIYYAAVSAVGAGRVQALLLIRNGNINPGVA